ncbi:hypothetical protein A1342_02115 [Methylomonas methanica]|uniref:asparagine synthase (glutamine-hydrolyzing) n=3 Tax=Methylococcaceae TaxID=403 RepID=A0A140E3X2_9GAMM|nr:hypothetical protein JT25_001125 [Methylomonas denitrificans]OAI02586.1 hypothetical protein A1342_02115 [Methylomonas methanica]
MSHRGPDDSGLFLESGIALAQARLAIIDTTNGGHQPMASENDLIHIVYNGEIYNYGIERTLLESKGYNFKTKSDTEVVLKLYEEHGEGFLKRLRGIFALAIYDKRGGPGKEKLLLARDQFGIKPLLYSEINGTFIFASELKAILASGLVPRQVDSESLQQLLSLGSVYQPRTLVQGVYALPPAHYMVVDKSGSNLRRYWSYGLDRVAGLRQLPYLDQVEQFRLALTRSVKLQMVADVPVGAFLSGGVDSSLIVALMARETGGHVKTYSVGFEEGANATDESLEAEAMARHLETDHTRVVVTARDIEAHLEKFVFGLDQPSVDGLNSYFVSYAASQGVTVSLSGTGGDELFLGYPWFANIQNSFDGVYPKRGISFAHRLTTHLTSIIRGPNQHSVDTTGSVAFCEAFGRQYHCFGPRAANDILSASRRSTLSVHAFADDLLPCDELAAAELMDRASVFCLNGYTRNQLLRDIDACSMAHSLEVRVPFLDVELMDFALSLPVTSKLQMNIRTLAADASYAESGVKRIVCDASKKYLPQDFFTARAKKGFALPHADWMKGPLADVMAETLSWETVANAGLFDPSSVARIRKDFMDGYRPWSHPWLLMITELWRRQVLLN